MQWLTFGWFILNARVDIGWFITNAMVGIG